MKSVMLSIKPKYCELIANGEKTVEVRKTKPKIETPFKCYIYETKGKLGKEVAWRVWEYEGRGQVIGEFVCDYFDYFKPTKKGVLIKRFSSLHDTAISLDEIMRYLGGKDGYGWHISNLIIYDKPKELSEFGLKRPFQSWGYINENDT